MAYGKQWDPREGDGVAVDLRIVGAETGAFVEVRTADSGMVAQIDAGDYRKPEDILHAIVKTLRSLEESD